jgi:hypothetical protein
VVALAKASSSHASSRQSSPAADDPDDEKAEKEDVEAGPEEEPAAKQADVNVEASQLLLDSVSETAAAADARFRVSCRRWVGGRRPRRAGEGERMLWHQRREVAVPAGESGRKMRLRLHWRG